MSYKRRNNSRLPARSIGVAIIAAFFLVTLLFIVLYAASDQARDPGQPVISSNGDASAGNPAVEVEPPQPEHGEPPPGQDVLLSFDPPDDNDGEDPADDPANDPDDDTSTVRTVDGSKVAYLTFDDGPTRDITNELLDILKREEIRATFFVLPSQGVDDLFKRIIDEGHELGNHSYSHVYSTLYERTVDDFKQNVSRAHDFIKDNFGYTMTSFRFPGGFTRAGDGFNSRHDVIKDLGYRHIHWMVDPQDWRRSATASEITKEVLDQVKALGREQNEHVIVLMHDYVYSQATVAALPDIIKGLRELGYEFDIVRNYPADLRTGFGSRT